jgi:Spy/CpxP family protein refolding chaperone
VGLLALAALLGGAAPARAQGPAPGFKAPPAPPVFLQRLFVPELVMRYQAEIALTADQREAISHAMVDAQKRLVDLQWQFESASKKLADLLGAATIDEAVAAAETERLLNLELQMKKAHVALLVRIKNVLTPGQQSRLAELRAREPQRPGPPPPRPGP